MQFVLFLLAFCNIVFTYGQSDVVIETTLSYDTVDVDEVFKLKFTVEGANVLEDVMCPELVDLKLVAGPNTGHVFQMNNGQSTHRFTYSFMIKSIKEGLFILPSIPVVTDQGTFYTEEKVVVVTYLTPEQKQYRSRKKSRELFSFFSEPMEDPMFKSFPNLDLNGDFSLDFFNGFSMDNDIKKWMEEIEKQLDLTMPRMDSIRMNKKKDKARIYKM